MMNWIRISQILCLFGFLKEFRPNEPYIYNYLTEWKNFTSNQVIHDIIPLGTYSNFTTLVVLFLLTDLLRYKPVIILCGISGTITFIILTLGKTIISMQIVEFFYGLYMSAEIAYHTYIYAKVDIKYYQKVSSYTRSSLLLGRFITGITGQLLISYDLFNYHQLNYLTILGQLLATIWSLLLPSVGVSVYFHRPIDNTIDSNHPNDNTTDQCQIKTINNRIMQKINFKNIKYAYYLLWNDFLKAYTNIYVLKWSLWWAFGNCGYLQVLTYSQSIWKTCIEENEKMYNGAVEAIYTLIGALAVFGIGKLKFNWILIGDIILTIFSLLQALLLYIMSTSYNIMLQYIIYMAFGIIYQLIMTVCTCEIAKKISADSFGLIFGINIFFTLTIQSVLTFIVTTGNVFIFDIRTQFAIYSGYFVLLAVIFMIIAIFTIIKLCKSDDRLLLWLNNDKRDNDNSNSIDERVN